MDPAVWSTGQVATRAGCSVQQVRDLERLGVIPPAQRAANGYRHFGTRHVLALRAYRNLAHAVGPVRARTVMRGLDAVTLPEAVAAVTELHTELARAREGALAARRALAAIRAESITDPDPAGVTGDDALTITELAGALGVRTSTLRFWESEGLLRPERVTRRHARSYPPSAARDARIVAALRSAGYRIPDVRRAMAAVHGFDTNTAAGLGDPAAALERRLESLAAQMLALLHAGTDLAALLESAPAPRAAMGG
ncbi:MerR family transcriptional regulator [Ruania alba]|uniref:DNA-binding transcriptional regulator, MerR family n=1 Tax=Ruania alba TaxID=648782 RepID=A0A1H5KU47_9MICO|nr:MerR family transcriptional regulator [Ruania alba]SEE68366.1 DNA-binding transcriptional regulator, MerR family [Ruania alba]